MAKAETLVTQLQLSIDLGVIAKSLRRKFDLSPLCLGSYQDLRGIVWRFTSLTVWGAKDYPTGG